MIVERQFRDFNKSSSGWPGKQRAAEADAAKTIYNQHYKCHTAKN